MTAPRSSAIATKDKSKASVRARTVIGADGALSPVARQAVPGAERVPYVFAYHEIVRTKQHDTGEAYDPTRCDIYYQGAFSPDFYAWVFPHGDTASVGTGSANKGFSLRQAVGALRQATGLDATETVRREGAPIPLRPLKKWDNGRDVVLAGDAAGVVAPASGEGIYYAMTGGRLAADAVDTFLATGDARALATARKRFMKAHGRVFWILGDHAALLVFERVAARALRHHVQRPRRAAADLGELHEQEARALAAGGARAHLLQGSRPSVRAGVAMRSARSNLWLPVLGAAAAAILVASLGATMTELGPWYHELKKPSWQPPDWLFGPAWTLIFALAACAGVVAWRNARSDADREWIIGLFAINGTLNVLWSALFFRLHRPDWALIEVALLWLSMLVPMIVFSRYAKTASLLLVPYLAWVSFAAFLNFEIVRLNGPFG